MNQNLNNQKLFVGTDVSKETLDVLLLLDSNRHYHKQFTNDSKGYKQLLSWLETCVQVWFGIYYNDASKDAKV